MQVDNLFARRTAVTYPLYTIGYGGMSAGRLAKIVHALNAVLVDIRFRAASRKPEWNKGALTKLFGDRYLHLSSLGNELYRSGGVKIADYQAGKEMIESIAMPVVLLCACASPEECHRTVVGDMLRADGYTVIELTRTEIEKALATADPVPTPSSQMSFWSE
jgi:uncharacterized protein (DUF488 family)